MEYAFSKKLICAINECLHKHVQFVMNSGSCTLSLYKQVTLVINPCMLLRKRNGAHLQKTQ